MSMLANAQRFERFLARRGSFRVQCPRQERGRVFTRRKYDVFLDGEKIGVYTEVEGRFLSGGMTSEGIISQVFEGRVPGYEFSTPQIVLEYSRDKGTGFPAGTRTSSRKDGHASIPFP
ncbi:MAG: hypothetical protein HYW25_00825 [Candidatus Aenigmarchaeota archaeon]|nr:hypothetical protein [Candidatus Aenigmarchaeota archaeon]